VKVTSLVLVLVVALGLFGMKGASPNTARVPDETAALQIAEPVLIKIYGKRVIDDERPLKAMLVDGVWNVYGTLCCPDKKGHCEFGCAGGVAHMKIRQSDGKVLSVMHTK
jgi:hypothetical protein